MKRITSITSKSKQQMTLALDNNETVDFKLYYFPRQQSWYFDFKYNDLIVNGLKVVISPNATRQFKNIMSFGIAFAASSFIEPFAIDDFETGRVNMYVLTKEDVELAEKEIYNND